ncbi:olfactory receptor 52J3-like [Trichomycterus rosablanca]|uniref:olfactory receptor 52J3-like n=1 Tax=Trichomycterus rosablanca TaxID=2290929 RepID=UPI002F35587E
METQVTNNTFSFSLQIGRFDVPSEAVYPVFIIGALIYLFAVFCNVTILILIVTQPSLHKPMFYIMFSLPLSDLIGITVAFPRVLVDIITQINTVYYPTCVLQGFLLHLYGGSVLFNLAAMSVDRYVAICKPLRYHSIMNPHTVCGIIFLAWGLDVSLIVMLFALQARLTKCKTFIFNVYCDNMSLVKLSCSDDFAISNIFGLFLTGFMQGISVCVQLFSYVHIFKTCFSHKDARIKAINTCLAQLITFCLFEIVTSVAILSYRFPNVSLNTLKICGLLIFTILPVCNPIIYGMKTKEIRQAFIIVLKKHKVSVK